MLKAVLLSIAHDSVRRRKKCNSNTYIVAGEALVDNLRSGLQTMEEAGIATLDRPLPIVIRDRALFERIMCSEHPKNIPGSQRSILLHFANTAFLQKHSEEEVTSLKLSLSVSHLTFSICKA